MYFSPDGKRLGSVSYKGVVAIWDLNTGACLQTLNFDLGTTIMNDDWKLRRAQSQCFIANVLQNPGAICEFDISSNNSWLLRRKEPFLWLPPRYRSEYITFAQENIAIVLCHETLLLFSFSLAEMDAEMASNRSSILKV